MSASASERAGSSRVARQGLILELIQAHEIGSQNELADMLAEHGIRVSQGTLSKDLLDIGAVRVRSSAGVLVYAPPGLDVASDRTLREQRLARICAEVLVSAEASANLLVIKTPPGAAQLMAAAVDDAMLPGVLGTIAGDNTILIATTGDATGLAIAQHIASLSDRTPESPGPH